MVSQDGAHSRLPVSDPPPRYKGGIDGFLEHSEKLANRDVIITHQLVPAVIDVRGTKGYAESNCLIMSRFPHDGHDYDMSCWCHLLSRVEKVDGAWKILTLDVIYLRDLIVPVPGSPELDFSQVKDWPRKSYKFTTWHLIQRGLVVRKDLPGWDDEQSVNQVRGRNLVWLNQSDNRNGVQH